jgi:cysteine synthase
MLKGYRQGLTYKKKEKNKMTNKTIGKDILNLIGDTRLVDISGIINVPNVQVAAKMEHENPGGSVKDRPVKHELLEAIKSGELIKGKTIIEATSGNTGISLAMLSALLGYKFVAVMSDGVSIERQQMIRAFGADIILTPSALGVDGAIRRAEELVAKNPDKYFYADQFNNPNNALAHYKTADEIWEQTNGSLTHFVATVGTSGTFMGTATKLKKWNPNIKVIEVQPPRGHKLQGLKSMNDQIVPKLYNPKLADHLVMTNDQSSFKEARHLAKNGLFMGMSSGSAIHAIRQMVKNPKIVDPNKEAKIVTIFPDNGMKYLSTDLYKENDSKYLTMP